MSERQEDQSDEAPIASTGQPLNERATTERMPTEQVRELIEQSKEGEPEPDEE